LRSCVATFTVPYSYVVFAVSGQSPLNHIVSIERMTPDKLQSSLVNVSGFFPVSVTPSVDQSLVPVYAQDIRKTFSRTTMWRAPLCSSAKGSTTLRMVLAAVVVGAVAASLYSHHGPSLDLGRDRCCCEGIVRTWHFLVLAR
jgi:hypothetical protein